MAIYSQMKEDEWLTVEKMAVRIHLPYNHVSSMRGDKLFLHCSHITQW